MNRLCKSAPGYETKEDKVLMGKSSDGTAPRGAVVFKKTQTAPHRARLNMSASAQADNSAKQQTTPMARMAKGVVCVKRNHRFKS